MKIEGLDYNTQREHLVLPEYGREIQRMVDHCLTLPTKSERQRCAETIVSIMDRMFPQNRQNADYKHKLWDHLFIIAGYDLDIDSPYPAPVPESRTEAPHRIPLRTKPVKATHYGRNIESIIDLIAAEEDGEQKNVMLHRLATYMRQQYLIWNKDSVEDSTIFHDIEMLSDYRIKIPEGMTLSRVSQEANYSKPLMNMPEFQGRKNGHKNKGFRKNKKQF